ncbi:hypothetical protein JZ751_025483, partial [Albula glossodonta]
MLQTAELVSVSFLTDSEREIILEVLRRDEELRRSEEVRVRRLKVELLDIRRKGAKRSDESYSERSCGRCQQPLPRLGGGASRCPACNHQVCRNCRAVRPAGRWVCSVCAKEADLKKSTGDWFYDQRVNRFSDSPGHDIVKTSLRKRPQLKKRETVGQLLLQNRVMNPNPPATEPHLSAPQPLPSPPEPHPRVKDLLANENVPPSDQAVEQKEPQRSDTESVEKASLSSLKTETESSNATPILPRRDEVADCESTARLSPAGSCASTLNVPVKMDAAHSCPAEAEALTVERIYTLYILTPQGSPQEGSPLPPLLSEDTGLFKRNPRRTLKPSEYSRPTSVLDLRDGGPDVMGGSMGDRSRSVPGLNIQEEEEEEEEDIDSLVEIHRRTTGSSTMSLRSSRRTLGSLLSVYSEAGDYDSVDVSGDITFVLSYDDRVHTLSVLVKECRGLACGDAVRRRSNPYVKCYLLPDKSRQSKRKTTTKRSTLNPVYHETLKYSIPRSQLLTRSLQLSVWHHDRFGRNAFLGEVELPLDCRGLESAHEECVALRGKTPSSALSSAFAQYKGELVISLKYVSANELSTDKMKGKKKKKEESGELHVLIKEAKNLTAMKAGGTSDSFVKGYLLPCKTKATKRKTPVVKKTLNPHYDHTFVYHDLRLDDLKTMYLELTVVFSVNERGLCVAQGVGPGGPSDSTDEEVCLWQKMMQYPDSWAEGALPLRSSMEGRPLAWGCPLCVPLPATGGAVVDVVSGAVEPGSSVAVVPVLLQALALSLIQQVGVDERKELLRGGGKPSSSTTVTCL